jgi:hypothetical protein
MIDVRNVNAGYYLLRLITADGVYCQSVTVGH